MGLCPYAAEWDGLSAALSVMELVDTTSTHVARARQVQRLLAERHRRGRKLPDLLIAAAAEEHGLTVMHYDADVDVIVGVTGQSAEWVVDRGPIDRVRAAGACVPTGRTARGAAAPDGPGCGPCREVNGGSVGVAG